LKSIDMVRGKLEIIL